MEVIGLGGLVQFGPHPGTDLVCDGAVKLRITRAPFVGSRRDRRVKSANEQAVHGFRRGGSRACPTREPGPQPRSFA